MRDVLNFSILQSRICNLIVSIFLDFAYVCLEILLMGNILTRDSLSDLFAALNIKTNSPPLPNYLKYFSIGPDPGCADERLFMCRFKKYRPHMHTRELDEVLDNTAALYTHDAAKELSIRKNT